MDGVGTGGKGKGERKGGRGEGSVLSPGGRKAVGVGKEGVVWCAVAVTAVSGRRARRRVERGRCIVWGCWRKVCVWYDDLVSGGIEI